MSYAFKTSLRVRFDEIDMQGVVHHPEIVTYLEVARMEYWSVLGRSYGQMRKDGYEFIIKNVNVEYLKPLEFEEQIDIHVGVKSVARASFVLGYEIFKEDGTKAVVAETGLVCSKVGIPKPTKLPDKFKSALESQL
jgi:acyl-CoA thioester hydrolase